MGTAYSTVVLSFKPVRCAEGADVSAAALKFVNNPGVVVLTEINSLFNFSDWEH